MLNALSSATETELREQAYVLETDVPNLALSNVHKVANESATIIDYEPDRVVLDVKSTALGILVLTDVDVPGWICTVQGDNTRIFSVYNAFRGVEIPSGHNQVIFRYRPWYTYEGVAISFLAMIATGLWFLRLHRHAATHIP